MLSYDLSENEEPGAIAILVRLAGEVPAAISDPGFAWRTIKDGGVLARVCGQPLKRRVSKSAK